MAGALTLGDIKQEMVNAALVTSEFQSDDEDTRLAAIANRALQEFCNAFEWPFLHDKIATLSFVSGTAIVDLPADFGGMPADRTPYYSGDNGYTLHPMSLEEMQHTDGAHTINGIPTNFAFTFNHTTVRHALRVWPTANGRWRPPTATSAAGWAMRAARCSCATRPWRLPAP